MPQALALKLQRYAQLTPRDIRAVGAALEGTVRHCRAREDVVREGDRPQVMRVFLDGWGIRYKMLPDGRRQIIAMLVPGDLCDLHNHLLTQMDHTIASLTPLSYAELHREQVDHLFAESRALTQALQIDQLVTASIQREWTVNMGQRTARERMAHLFCELYLRLQAVGRAENGRCDLPLTQTDLSEATGMTAVHANRTLQDLRRSGLVEVQGRTLAIPDLDALCDAALFNPLYLHQRVELVQARVER